MQNLEMKVLLLELPISKMFTENLFVFYDTHIFLEDQFTHIIFPKVDKHRGKL